MLRDLQTEFARSLLDDFRAPAPAGLVAGDPTRAARRFMIHRGNVVESLATALGHTYPAIKAICGLHNFRLLAATFVRTHPPERPELLAYGAGFATHIAAHPAALGDFPFLPDLAQLEWALNEVYYAAEAPALDADGLGGIPPASLGALRLALHPAARLVVSDAHPIHALWTAAAAQEVAPDPLALGDDLPQGGEAVLAVRHSGPVELFKLDAGEAIFLGAVAAGASLEEALTQADATDSGFDPAAALAAALSRGAFDAAVAFQPTPIGGIP